MDCGVLGMDEDLERINKEQIQKELHHDEFMRQIAGNSIKMAWSCIPNPHEIAENERKKQQEHALSLFLLDQFNKAIERVTNKINDLQQRVYEELIAAEERLQAAEKKLKTTLQSASTLADGITPVFKADDGSFYTARGKEVTGLALESIKKRDNAPSWEELQKDIDAVRKEHETVNKLKCIDAQVQGYSDEIEALRNDPSQVSMQRISEIEDSLDNIHDDISNSKKSDLDMGTKPNLDALEFKPF